MKDKILTILKTYADFYNTSTADMEKNRTDIHKRYSTDFAETEDKKLTEEYNEQIKAARESALKNIETEISNIKKTLSDRAAENIPEGFAEEYRLLKDVSMDENEFKAFAEKYKNNYSAAKLLNNLAEQNKLHCKVITLTDKIEALDGITDKCIKFIETYKGINTSYENENLLRGNIIPSCFEYTESNIVEL